MAPAEAARAPLVDHAADPVGTERIDRDGQHQRGIDAARQAQQHAGEAVLADVVAHAHHQRVPDLLLVGEILRLRIDLHDTNFMSLEKMTKDIRR